MASSSLPRLVPTVTFNVSAIVRILGSIIGLLLIASAASCWLRVRGIQPSFNGILYVDKEANFPTYFSALQLFIAASILGVIAWLERCERSKFTLHWTVLAGGFLLMSVDEICAGHEKLNQPVSALLGSATYGLFAFAWVIPAVVFVAVVGLGYWKFLAHLPNSTRNGCVLAGLLYLGGALGVELLGSRQFELGGWNWEDPLYMTFATLEEALEMVGVLVLIRTMLNYLATTYGGLQLALQAPGRVPEPQLAPSD